MKKWQISMKQVVKRDFGGTPYSNTVGGDVLIPAQPRSSKDKRWEWFKMRMLRSLLLEQVDRHASEYICLKKLHLEATVDGKSIQKLFPLQDESFSELAEDWIELHMEKNEREDFNKHSSASETANDIVPNLCRAAAFGLMLSIGASLAIDVVGVSNVYAVSVLCVGVALLLSTGISAIVVKAKGGNNAKAAKAIRNKVADRAGDLTSVFKIVSSQTVGQEPVIAGNAAGGKVEESLPLAVVVH